VRNVVLAIAATLLCGCGAASRSEVIGRYHSRTNADWVDLGADGRFCRAIDGTRTCGVWPFTPGTANQVELELAGSAKGYSLTSERSFGGDMRLSDAPDLQARFERQK
jgi:hypothetical protein